MRGPGRVSRGSESFYETEAVRHPVSRNASKSKLLASFSQLDASRDSSFPKLCAPDAPSPMPRKQFEIVAGRDLNLPPSSAFDIGLACDDDSAVKSLPAVPAGL
jgi:hypothetical protein